MNNNELYFDPLLSVGAYDVSQTLKTLSNRYIANNPQKPLTLREQSADCFLQEFSGRFIFDFEKKHPDAQKGDYAYAFAYAYMSEEGPAVMGFRAKTPAWVYMNGELIFETQSFDEGQYKPRSVCFTLKKGINTFLVKCKKNALGFGCEFGSAGLQNGALVFLNPISSEQGKRGWAYTLPQKEDIFSDSSTFPKVGDSPEELWLPVENNTPIPLWKMFGTDAGYIYLVSSLLNGGTKKEYHFKGEVSDICTVYIDGEKAFQGKNEVTFKQTLSSGFHQVCVEIKCEEGSRCSFDLSADGGFTLENILHDPHSKWLCMGKLKSHEEELLVNPDMLRVYEDCYWKTEMGDDIRLSSESAFYGRWTYPLGVVLYGLNEAAKEIGDTHIREYANAHISRLAHSYEYALWDTKKYGRANLDYQLMMIDSLDYCGSCGNAMLNILDYGDDRVKKLADDIASFMANGQERLSNGMFYRIAKGTYQENTIWADDLYMSVPFLCRYYKATGNNAFLEDAVKQFKGYYEYLYMPDKKIMSHVYGLNYNEKNEIPWGRGNGWVVFALSELLMVLPENHSEKEFLLSFFKELCEGILSYQDENGMWRQVIDEPSAYIESSCTSMFICAFSRGLQNGWLTEDKFAKAVYDGWKALCTYCIDCGGNLYGVCRGSMLSFRREYYLNELGWNLNDQHGTGIALLAGVEVLRLQK